MLLGYVYRNDHHAGLPRLWQGLCVGDVSGLAVLSALCEALWGDCLCWIPYHSHSTLCRGQIYGFLKPFAHLFVLVFVLIVGYAIFKSVA